MSAENPHIAVIGGGAWGTALALTAARAGNTTWLYVRNPDAAQDMRRRAENRAYLPGISFDVPLNIVSDYAALPPCAAYLLATPAQTLRTLEEIRTFPAEAPLIICAKGLDQNSGVMLTDVCARLAPLNPLAVLSGPSFAADVAHKKPTAVTLAFSQLEHAALIAQRLSTPNFRIYSSTDRVGVQIGGALKNVFAIACGCVIGAELGESARAALIARCFAEMRRVGKALGARAETLTGLSGLGDLMLTCTSPQSRNFSFGVDLGRGKMLSDLKRPSMKLVEGLYTATIASALTDKYGLSLPIITAVAQIATGKRSIQESINILLARPLRSEEEE